MNNKGFTLTELLAVILILIGIAAVSIFNVSSALNKNENAECERQKEIILNAAKIYKSLKDEEPEIDDLVSGGYITADDIGYFKKADNTYYSINYVKGKNCN